MTKKYTHARNRQMLQPLSRTALGHWRNRERLHSGQFSQGLPATTATCNVQPDTMDQPCSFISQEQLTWANDPERMILLLLESAELQCLATASLTPGLLTQDPPNVSEPDTEQLTPKDTPMHKHADMP